MSAIDRLKAWQPKEFDSAAWVGKDYSLAQAKADVAELLRDFSEVTQERDTHKKSLDMLYGRPFSERDYTALTAKLDDAKALNANWLAANGPGGWIDDQRRYAVSVREAWETFTKGYDDACDHDEHTDDYAITGASMRRLFGAMGRVIEGNGPEIVPDFDAWAEALPGESEGWNLTADDLREIWRYNPTGHSQGHSGDDLSVSFRKGWCSAIEAALCEVPGGDTCRPADVADAIRALRPRTTVPAQTQSEEKP